MRKGRCHRRRGATTFELVISSTIFAAVAIASTAMMTESIKGTTRSTVVSQSVDQSRLTMEKIQSDVRRADMVMSRVMFPNLSGWKPSDRDDVILRIPQFDSTGIAIPGHFRLVWWDEDPISGSTGPRHVVRYEVSYINGVVGPLPALRTYLTHVQTLNFRFYRQEKITVPPVRRLPLPGPAVSGNPTGNQVRMIGVRSQAVTGDDSDDERSDIGDLGFVRSGSNVLVPGHLPVGTELDIFYELDGSRTRTADGGNLANIVEVSIVHRRSTSAGPSDTSLTSRISLRND